MTTKTLNLALVDILHSLVSHAPSAGTLGRTNALLDVTGDNREVLEYLAEKMKECDPENAPKISDIDLASCKVGPLLSALASELELALMEEDDRPSLF